MSKPIPSTFNRYIPGVGYTLTRANVEAYQKERVRDGKEPLTPEELVLTFAPPGMHHVRENDDFKRLVHRARVVSTPKGEKL